MKLHHALIGGLTALVVMTVVLVGCSRSDGKTRHVKPVDAEHDAVALAGQAKGQVVAIGTLATVGSFEYGNASLVTIAAAALKHVPQQLHDKQLTPDQAQEKINAAVKARDLLKRANATCAQNGAGKCRGNQAQAEALVDQARSTLAAAGLGLN